MDFEDDKSNFRLGKDEKQNFRLGKNKKSNFRLDKIEKQNFRHDEDEKPNFRQRKSKNRIRQPDDEESKTLDDIKTILKNKDIDINDIRDLITKENEIDNKKVNIFWIFKRTALISFVQYILIPILIYLIGKILVSLPDVSEYIGIIFGQFNIPEEHVPMFLLLVNGIFVIMFNGMIGSIHYLRSYLEKTYGKDAEIAGMKYIDRACNLSRISVNNFVLYAIGVFGTLINSNANISLVAQLSVLYAILTIPYSVLVMMDRHYYLPLPQGALLFIYLSGCLSSRLLERGELYEKLVTLPATIREIRRNTIHY